MKKTAFFFITISLFLLFSCNNSNKNNNDESMTDTIDYPSYDDYQNDDDQASVDELLDSNDIATDDIMVEDDQGNVTPIDDEVIDQNNQADHNFFLIVGSFKIYNNAVELNNYFKNKNYKPVILPKAGPYNRVAIASFKDEITARKELKRVRSAFNNGTFWLLYK